MNLQAKKTSVQICHTCLSEFHGKSNVEGPKSLLTMLHEHGDHLKKQQDEGHQQGYGASAAKSPQF